MESQLEVEAKPRGNHRLPVVSLECIRDQPVGRASWRTATLGMSFGIPLFSRKVVIVRKTEISLAPGKIVLLAGPSGSGKSSALGRIEAHFAGACLVQRVTFPPGVAVIDRIAPWAPLAEALSIATSCGLSEASLWVRPFETLSEGEMFRARLARAVALHGHSGASAPLLCDEFCSNLHRRAAKAVSYNLRKLVTRRNLSVVVACGQDDLIDDLQPDLVVTFRGDGSCEVRERTVCAKKAISFRPGLRVVRGSKRDYERFAAMHYRASDELGFVDKVFVLREGWIGEILGIVVYSHGPLELSLRNQATGGRFSRNPKRVNRSFRILRRLVIHPDIRGCGLGHDLVRRSLPLVGTEYVECLAAMGEFNPVFETAGMQRIGQYEIGQKQKAALEALRSMDVDPNSREFTLQVCRRRRVREIVASVVRDWYAATTAGGEGRVARQSPQLLAQTFRGLMGSRPVYYLWRRKKRLHRKTR